MNTHNYINSMVLVELLKDIKLLQNTNYRLSLAQSKKATWEPFHRVAKKLEFIN